VTLDCFYSRPIRTHVGKSRRHPPSKVSLPVGINDSSLGPSKSTSQTASQSVQPFLKGSRSLQTDRQTDRPRYSVYSNTMHPASTAMRPNNTGVNVYSAVITTRDIVKVDPVHLINANSASGGRQPSNQANRPG